MSSSLPRILLGIFGVLSAALLWGDVQSIWWYGPTPSYLMMGIFAALITCVCFWAAIGKASLFANK